LRIRHNAIHFGKTLDTRQQTIKYAQSL